MGITLFFVCLCAKVDYSFYSIWTFSSKSYLTSRFCNQATGVFEKISASQSAMAQTMASYIFCSSCSSKKPRIVCCHIRLGRLPFRLLPFTISMMLAELCVLANVGTEYAVPERLAESVAAALIIKKAIAVVAQCLYHKFSHVQSFL